MFILSFISPDPKIFNLDDLLLINFNFFNKFEFKISEVLTLFLSIKIGSYLSLKLRYFFFSIGLNPLFGSLLYNGIWPPSKLFIDTPDLDFCPFTPLPEVFPLPDAIKKANEMARRKLIHIPLREGRTIHHDVKAKDGSGRIVLRAASKGTGIIAGGPVRAVCEVLGVKDIVAKSMGTSNAHNVIRATMKALLKQNSPKQISNIRNKKISEIIEKRG